MTVVDDRLGRRDRAALARMHVEALPESLVSRVGERYARAFYRYAARSRDELVLLDRDGDGALRAACLVSLAPATLPRRLLVRTPLALHALAALPRLPLRALVGGKPGPATARQPDGPEILLVFTVPAARSHGLGARLLARAEALVAARGAGRLLVKTRDVPENRALGFYQRVGFARIATVESHGKRLALFAKPVAAAPAGPDAC